MTRLMEQLQKPLTAKEIDFRVQSINSGGYATILAYKDARVDMRRLDDVFGPYGWQRDYKTVGNLMLCGVSIWDKDRKQWVTKWDTGTESNTEAQKGLASDAFKRACFNLGIGRELYDYPVIQVKLKGDGTSKGDEWVKQGRNGKPQQTWSLRLRDWTWLTEFKDGVINFVAAKDQSGELRFQWGELDAQGRRLRSMFKKAFAAEADDVQACLAMYEVSQEAGDDLWKELNDFEKDKTVSKNKVTSMHNKGAAIMRQAASDYAIHVKNDDELGMAEIIDDLTPYCKNKLLEAADRVFK